MATVAQIRNAVFADVVPAAQCRGKAEIYRAHVEEVLADMLRTARKAEATVAKRTKVAAPVSPLVFGPWERTNKHSVSVPELTSQPGYDFDVGTTLDTVYMSMAKVRGKAGVTLAIGSNALETYEDRVFKTETEAANAAYGILAKFCAEANHDIDDTLYRYLQVYEDGKHDDRSGSLRDSTIDRLHMLSVAANSLPAEFVDHKLAERVSKAYRSLVNS